MKLYALVLAISVLPLIHIFTNPGLPHTSDGLMHVARSAAYLNELSAGQLPVRWASQFNYGYGTPIFNFFNPIPYAFGALLLSLGFNLATILKIGFAITYLLGGIFTLLFAKTLFKNTKIAFLVTMLYQFAPFRLVEMHTRGDIGCLYSYMLLPLVFYSIIKLLEKYTYPRVALVAISIALLPLTHNINGFVYFCLSGLFVLFMTRDLKKIVTVYFAMGFGILLTSSFIFPALFELKYLNGYIFSKHLFYMHFPQLYKLFLPNITNLPSLRVEEVSVQIGLFHLISFFGMAYFLWKKKIMGKHANFSLFLIIVSFLTFLIMTPITKPLWENIEHLRQFQFPWRFLSILIFTTSVAGGFFVQNVPVVLKRNTYITIVILIIFSTFFYWWPYQGYLKINENYYRNYPGSTNYFAEVNTIWMEKEPQNYPKKRIEVIGGKATLSNISIKPENQSFTVTAINDVQILSNTYFYPGWKVTANNQKVPIEFQDSNHRGLITFHLPQGTHNVTVTYSENKISKVSNVLSVVAIGILLFGFIPTLLRKNAKKKK